MSAERAPLAIVVRRATAEDCDALVELAPPLLHHALDLGHLTLEVPPLVGVGLGRQHGPLLRQLLVALVQALLLLRDLFLVEPPPRLNLVADGTGCLGVLEDPLVVDHRRRRRR